MGVSQLHKPNVRTEGIHPNAVSPNGEGRVAFRFSSPGPKNDFQRVRVRNGGVLLRSGGENVGLSLTQLEGGKQINI